MTGNKEQQSWQAYEAYEEGDYGSAFAIWHALAEGGDATAQNNLSAMYDAGEGVQQDHRLAYEWALKAAKSANPAAWGTVGSKLLSGSGVAQDVEKGIEILHNAADGGDARSMRVLGSLYLQGIHRPKDVNAALHWLGKAAELEEPLAQFLLATVHDLGQDVPLNRETSTKWYLRSADNGHIPSMFPAGARLIDGQGVAQNVPKGLWFLKTAANDGIAHAMRKLGDVYMSSKSVPSDRVEALYWYEQAAQQGNVDAQFLLGMYYTQGSNDISFTLEPERGVYWLEQAVAQDDADAMSMLAKLLFNGQGVACDKPRALALVTRGTELGDPLCQYLLGRYFLTGSDVPVDLVKGLDLVRMAAAQDLMVAKSCLCGLRIRGLEGLLTPEPDAAIEELKGYLDDMDREAACDAGMHFYTDKERREDAIFWLERAALAEMAAAYFYLGVLLIKSERPEAVQDGIAWLKKACPSEGGRAEFNLADIYLCCEKVERDFEQAWLWATRSSELGCDFGTLTLVQLHIDAESSHYDPVEAVRLAHGLAAKGLHNAMTLLGYAYDKGLGVAASSERALSWYASAAQAGSSESARILGIKYFDGEGVPASRAEAVKWFALAADKGDMLSMLYLMFALAQGHEIPEDMVRAYTYLALARPYATGKELELIEVLEPDFRSQISEEERELAQSLADELRRREDFSPA